MNTFEYILTKIEGTHDKDMPLRIPNVGRLDLARWFRELDFQTGVEIGVAEGEYSKILCEVNPQLKLFGVDPYVGYKEYGDYVRKSTFNRLKEEAHTRLDPYVQRGRYVLYEEMSIDALKRFEDNSLDFVYIDGNHQDPYVTQDIEEWTKKVKIGGIVAGHDYSRIKRVKWDVKDAIHKYTEENGLNWFVLGLDEVLPGMVRDGSRSWMFVR